MGDFDDFQIELGLLEERLTPPLQNRWMKDPELEWEVYRESQLKFEQLTRKIADEGEKKSKPAKKTRRRKRG